MIRWINEQLGTAAFTDPEIGPDLTVLDVRDLVDKHGNSVNAIREKIKQGVVLLREGQRVVVCCDYGISRSNAIAAGILSQQYSTSLAASVRQVIQATGEKEIKLGPLRAVRAVLEDADAAPLGGEIRLLITGGSGFIGKQLQKTLGSDIYWIAPSRSEADLSAGALELNLLVKEHRINTIVHLANPRVYTSNRAMGETITLLRNVLEVCQDNNLRLIYPSGWEVYSGYCVNSMLVNEATPLLPKGPYGETKVLCEQLIGFHQSQYGLRCALLRSSPLYGESSDRPKFIYNFLAKALSGSPIQTHRYLNGDPYLDLMHVDDFVAAVVAAIHSNFDGTLNIGSGQAVSTREVAEWIARKCHSNSTIDSKNIEEYAPNITMNNSRAERDLGWLPSTFWQDGLNNIIQNAVSKFPVGDDCDRK
ncbi:MAG: NAD-dependent epimerase/dehydratase family protein [Halomonas sp.]|nr:NAD-dependent epimerase/dehydratase family protein [Halomonas sp.]MBL1269220.1 NAD-dependent epimerase/dehydratase family protein [Halomonas sp.]